jgi:hypothetical protein
MRMGKFWLGTCQVTWHSSQLCFGTSPMGMSLSGTTPPLCSFERLASFHVTTASSHCGTYRMESPQVYRGIDRGSLQLYEMSKKGSVIDLSGYASRYSAYSRAANFSVALRWMTA